MTARNLRAVGLLHPPYRLLIIEAQLVLVKPPSRNCLFFRCGLVPTGASALKYDHSQTRKLQLASMESGIPLAITLTDTPPPGYSSNCWFGTFNVFGTGQNIYCLGQTLASLAHANSPCRPNTISYHIISYYLSYFSYLHQYGNTPERCLRHTCKCYHPAVCFFYTALHILYATLLNRSRNKMFGLFVQAIVLS